MAQPAVGKANETPDRYVAPSAEFRADRYYRYAELTDLLHSWAAAYPELAAVESIGKSYEGRDIWALTLTNRATGPDAEKPAYYVDANIHAGEVTGSAVALFTAHHLLTGYGDDPRATRLLDETALYVVPRIGVDGAERYLASPEQMRSSVRPWPEPEPQDGVQREDLDGDGWVTQMRVRDPHGPWKVSTRDPRLMVRRGPDETGGEYYFVFPEGTIKDYDGGEVKVAPPLWGLDNNRNFPARWGPEWEQRGAGAYPLSEPETRAVADFMLAHPNIHGTQHYHTFSGVILRASALRADEDLAKADLKTYKALAELGTEETGYRVVSIFHDFAYDKKKPMMGNHLDWVFDSLGCFGFATELWSLPAKAGIEVVDFLKFFDERSEDDDLAMLKVLDQQLGGSGYKPWVPFEHPQLGPVEIGGWEFKFTFQNPPGPFLEEECRRNAGFTLRAMGTAPRLELVEASTEPLGGDLHKVAAVVGNAGFLPTYVSESGKATGRIKPVSATLGLGDGMALVGGEEETELGHLMGRADQYEAFSVFPAYGNSTRRRVEWIVRAPDAGTVTVTATSPKGGVVRRELTLGTVG
ncbi:MAG: hypothetical protein AVDCRST_MAG49-335 [uncultured Thermomicrobiales bacterium]|uniref:Peptidase M14 domain-containing protein n=1 Tax=uncultured Thermomicrobiales bacterium TaxID=1645740 RepID=A0A6J4TXB2_9BACT|nr:MAG: hypothetical protein AVDCRST_MAG49-335 [uncultured Thermomicrobiales bacterium]